MTINLSQFVNKEVTVTLRNGKIITGTLTRNNSEAYPYQMLYDWSWTNLGNYYISEPSLPLDIKSIVETTPKQMGNKQQLLKSIQETEQQLNKLKEQLEQQKAPTIQEAVVGDTLDDGSIVIKKENGLALVVAPKSTQVECQWTRQFSEVFDKLSSKGFIPSQWFVPTLEQLQLAYKVIDRCYLDDSIRGCFWTSSELDAYYACGVANGSRYNFKKNNPNCVRVFRCISY
jgi:hypothetical protein